MRSRIVLLVLLAALVACKRETAPPLEHAGPAPAATPAKAVDAAPTPALRVATLDGGTFDLAEHRGKWVLVNYWATWCGPCIKEMPELSALDAMREHIVVVGLAYEDTAPEAMQAFLRKHPVVYPIAMVNVYDPPKDFGSPRGLPTTFVIAPDGRIAKKYVGPVSARMVEEDIAKAGGPKAG